MNGSDPRLTSARRDHRAHLAGFILAVLVGLTACGPPPPTLTEQSLTHLQTWFDAAASGARDDGLCHGLGLLKHDQFTCAEMLEHAARIKPESREVVDTGQRDCFESVCGEFVEINLTGTDAGGRTIAESVILKRDDGNVQVYWYRSDSLLAAYRQAHPELLDADEKDPEQVAYDALVARYPGLYSYPPCYGQRVSSSTLQGELIRIETLDVNEVEALATACPEDFCFAFVGTKVAGLCPTR